MRELLRGLASSTRPWGGPATFLEAHRILSANVGAALADRDHRCVMVTSSQPREGRTVIATGLAAAFASQGERVVLVDLDLRQPTLHVSLGCPNERGVTEVLRSEAALQEAVRYHQLGPRANERQRGRRGHFVLTAGAVPADPAELVSSRRAGRLLEKLQKSADIVILDSPPVLPFADSLTIGRAAGAALLVVNTRRTNTDDVTRSRDLLQRDGVSVVGIALNGVHATDGAAVAWDGTA